MRTYICIPSPVIHTGHKCMSFLKNEHNSFLNFIRTLLNPSMRPKTSKPTATVSAQATYDLAGKHSSAQLT